MKRLNFPRSRFFHAIVCVVAFAAPALSESVAGKVESIIKRSAVLSNYEIEIEDSRGHITLTGRVKSDRDKDLVEEVASSVPGVRSVNNQLRVESVARGTASSDLSRRIQQLIKSEQGLGAYSVKIADLDGAVTLQGNVRSSADSATIERIARSVSGVVRVDNQLQIEKQIGDDSLEKLVRTELQDRNGIDLNGIEIVAQAGVVTFSGVRENHRQIDQILSAALMVAGVNDIRNEIKLEKR